jgi:hypothetical protein
LLEKIQFLAIDISKLDAELENDNSKLRNKNEKLNENRSVVFSQIDSYF